MHDTVKLVIDTNVWLDWLLFQDGSTAVLDRLASAGALQCLGSPQTRSEWMHVLNRASIAPLLTRVAPSAEQAISQLGARYDQLTQLVPEPAAPSAFNRLFCTDPDDQVFLDLAIEHHAQFLISRDRALLKLARRAQLQFALVILTPNRFTDTYRSQGQQAS